VGIGVSIFLIAIGAILRWAVSFETPGIALDVVGLILLVVGIIGLVMSLVLWSSVGSWYPRRRVVREETVVDEDRHIDRAA